MMQLMRLSKWPGLQTWHIFLPQPRLAGLETRGHGLSLVESSRLMFSWLRAWQCPGAEGKSLGQVQAPPTGAGAMGLGSHGQGPLDRHSRGCPVVLGD